PRPDPRQGGRVSDARLLRQRGVEPARLAPACAVSRRSPAQHGPPHPLPLLLPRPFPGLVATGRRNGTVSVRPGVLALSLVVAAAGPAGAARHHHDRGADLPDRLPARAVVPQL